MIQTMTREEYEKKYGTKPLVTSVSDSIKLGNQTGEKGIPGVGVGIAKGALSTVKGMGQLGEKILPPPKQLGSAWSDEATKGKLFGEENLQAKGTAEKIGKFGEQIAEFALPGGAVSKATKGLSFIPKVASRAATSAGVATLQEGEVGKGTAIAGGVEAAIPVAGKIIKPAVKFIGSLFKGVGSGLSGAPSEAIEQIYQNPKVALEAAKKIKESGSVNILRKNAIDIREGVSKIKQEARQSYGKGLEQLKKEDIDPSVFRENISKILDKYGVVSNKGVRTLGNVEFDDPKNIKRATELINKINKTELDGVSLRKLADDIENSKFKTATSDERLSYNVFIKDLSDSVKNAINSSTGKLDEINKAFSTDMQLAEAVEDILGDVKYTRNLGEINRTAKKLESLFTQKGLDPNTVDTFLEKVGISSGAFKSTEGMRQLTEKTFSANTIGTSPFEVIRAFTSAVVSPNMVGKIAAYTGLAENVVKEMANRLSPTTRGAIIKLLMGTQESQQ